MSEWGESRTVQSQYQETEINAIMRRWNVNQAQHAMNQTPPTYGDFTYVGEYRDALERVAQAEEDFNALPSGIREEFDNDPAELIAFLDDPENQDEAVEMGLIPAPPADGSASGGADAPPSVPAASTGPEGGSKTTPPTAEKDASASE